MNEKKITIIIPHYNSPQLLRKTLKSIYSAENSFCSLLQVIVVDDKSDEDSKKQLSEIASDAEFSRVLFLDNTTDKKGAGVCRNIALKEAVGEWLLFADADDYFLPDYDKAVSDYLEDERELIIFKPTSVQLETGAPASRHRAYANLVDQYLEKGSEQAEYELKYTFVTPWSKLIKRSVVKDNDIWFDEIAVANDVMFTTKCAYYSKGFGVDEREIYCVTRAAKTLTTKKDEAKFDLREEVLLRRFDFLKSRLTKKQLSYVHLGRVALSHILNAIIYGYGIKKAFSLLGIYIRHHMPLFDAQLLNPIVLYKQAVMYLSWRKEDKKYQ